MIADVGVGQDDGLLDPATGPDGHVLGDAHVRAELKLKWPLKSWRASIFFIFLNGSFFDSNLKNESLILLLDGPCVRVLGYEGSETLIVEHPLFFKDRTRKI